MRIIGKLNPEIVLDGIRQFILAHKNNPDMFMKYSRIIQKYKADPEHIRKFDQKKLNDFFKEITDIK